MPKNGGQERYFNFSIEESCGPGGLAKSNMSTHVLPRDVFTNEQPQPDSVVRRTQKKYALYIYIYIYI